jgi:hypothetical protein
LEKVLEVIAFGSKYAAASRWMMDAAGAPQLIDGQGDDLRSRRCYFVATRPLISKLQPLQSAFILGTMCSIPRKYVSIGFFLRNPGGCLHILDKLLMPGTRPFFFLS